MFKRRLVGGLTEALLGKRNLYRLARLLAYQARRDTLNDFHSNGEAMVQAVVLKHCPAAMVFDVGANVGDWSRALLTTARDRSELRVHAFEPCAGTFAMLAGKISDPRFTPVNLGCSDRPGVARMHVLEDGCGINSLLDFKDQPTTLQQVALTTIADYSQQCSISRIDLLKIDAEGTDFSVLEGALPMLRAQAISVVQFEYNFRWITSRHFLKDAMELLLELGYSVGKVTPDGIEFYDRWDYRLETFCEGNYLACTPATKPWFTPLRPDWIA